MNRKMGEVQRSNTAQYQRLIRMVGRKRNEWKASRGQPTKGVTRILLVVIFLQTHLKRDFGGHLDVQDWGQVKQLRTWAERVS